MAEWYGCKLWVGILFFILGIIFILKDYGVWQFKLQAWSAVLVILGLALLLCPKKRSMKK